MTLRTALTFVAGVVAGMVATVVALFVLDDEDLDL